MKSQIESVYEVYLQYPRINTDTRKKVADSIFFALKGKNFNANEYAAEALKNGAILAIVDEVQYKLSDSYVLVDDVLKFLQELAKFHRRHLHIPFIGITGTNGKTTTKELIATSLARKYHCASTKGNLNNHIGVPLSILSIDAEAEIAIIEMGANHIGEIKELCEIAQPNFGLITNIGKAHLEGFGSVEGVIKAKSELYQYISNNRGTLFVNGDDPLLMKLAGDARKIIYGSNENGHCIGYLRSAIPNVEFDWKCNFGKTVQLADVKSKLFGEYNFHNLLTATCIASYFEVDSKEISKSLSEYEPKNNRSEIIQNSKNKIILDAYNANPSSMHAAISSFLEERSPSKMLILGDMFELGTTSETEHQLLIDLVNSYEIKDALFIGKNFYKLKSKQHLFFEQRKDAEQYLTEHPPIAKVILIKGSRGIELEKLLPFIP